MRSFFPPPHRKIKTSEIAGYAILVKDTLLGKKYWVAYREEAYDEIAFTEEQPLIFPPGELPAGTRVYLLLPKE
jgi:hypothetical protein